MAARNHRVGRLSIETGCAALTSIAVGVGAAWFVYALASVPAGRHLGLLPSALSVGLFLGFSLMRAPRHEVSYFALGAAILAGLGVVVIVGSVVIQIIGCRYGSCINL